MRVNPIISQILQAPFLIEGQSLQMLYAEIAQLLNGQSGGQEGKAFEPQPVAYFALTPHAAALGVMSYGSLDEVPAGSVAVHTVAGVMLPEDTWYGTGTKTIGQRIQRADAHENIVAHVGVFRTPGGSTMGLENFAGIIAGTQKPFVGHVEQACSAGYWSVSGADVVMIAGRTAMCGSIGTMAEFLDFSGFYEKMGIKQVTAYATKSTDKNAAFTAAIAGNLKPLQEEVLDPLNEVFLATVRTNREGKLDAKQDKAVTSGKVFVGQANLDQGLADQMGSFDEAVALAQQLAEDATDSSDTPNSTTNSMFGKNKFTAVAALATLSAAALTPELMTAANDELEAQGVTGAQLITEAEYNNFTAQAGLLSAAQASVTATADALKAAGVDSIQALVKQRDDAQAKADEYGSQAGELPTTVAKKKGDVTEEGGDDDAKMVEALHKKMLGEV
jgi:ClpP class serine protease